jgi:hypothetical protein
VFYQKNSLSEVRAEEIYRLNREDAGAEPNQHGELGSGGQCACLSRLSAQKSLLAKLFQLMLFDINFIPEKLHKHGPKQRLHLCLVLFA